MASGVTRGKHIFFALIKCQGRVYPPIQQASLAKVNVNSVIYTHGFNSHDGLLNTGYKKYYRVKHSENEFAKGRLFSKKQAN